MRSAHAPTSVALIGVTASGKSALAHEVARDLGDVEIATIDSMTVYRGMDLGTAKATPVMRAEVPYHLVDLVEPDQEYTLGQFQRAAGAVRADVARRSRRLLWVGGTALYSRAIIDDLEIPGQFPALRAQLEARAVVDVDALYAQLVDLDPLAASRMEPNNQRRIVRALEVTIGSGRAFSSYGPGLGSFPPSPVAQVGLRVAMSEIDRRIEERFALWMRQGLLDEVRALAERVPYISRTARQAVGYRELLAHFENDVPLDVALGEAVVATRRLARRQRSWFSRDPRVEWFDEPDAAGARIRELLVSTTMSVGSPAS